MQSHGIESVEENVSEARLDNWLQKSENKVGAELARLPLILPAWPCMVPVKERFTNSVILCPDADAYGKRSCYYHCCAVAYGSECHSTVSLEIVVSKPRVSTTTLEIILKIHRL